MATQLSAYSISLLKHSHKLPTSISIMCLVTAIVPRHPSGHTMIQTTICSAECIHKLRMYNCIIFCYYQLNVGLFRISQALSNELHLELKLNEYS